ncbi:kunitz trypsin inhibitor 5-like [Primulina huaijiensis]|uniref:kunitz trypsin inhibitor 5-like n=1 Tax=Primulina huaijiensis TaxID=1492673 RepID=UPI003CC73E05
MKINLMITQIAILILIFISSTSEAAEQPAPVLDTDGKALRAGVSYYVLPVLRGRGGGLTLDSTDEKNPCPLDVVQEQSEVDRGLPLYFKPVNPKKGIIRLATDLNVLFNASSICVQTTLWKLDERDVSTGKYFITTGGVEGNPGRQTLSNWFNIQRYENDYKLVYCPTVCDICRPICGDLGIFIKDGKRRLALSDIPLKVMFKKD